jgi:hypothetical protein
LRTTCRKVLLQEQESSHPRLQGPERGVLRPGIGDEDVLVVAYGLYSGVAARKSMSRDRISLVGHHPEFPVGRERRLGQVLIHDDRHRVVDNHRLDVGQLNR